MKWQFNNDKPIYAQIIEIITLAIVSGELSPGEKMFSVREFAEEAGVNPNTMQKALSELENTGLLYSSRTSGRFITGDKEIIKDLKEKIAKEKTEKFLKEMKTLGFNESDITKIMNKIGW